MDRHIATTIGFAVHVGAAACFMSYRLIGDKSACSEATAIRSVKRLEAAGWLKIIRTSGRRANTFTLVLPPPLRFPEAEDIRQLAEIGDAKRDKFASYQIVKNSSPDAGEPLRSYARVEVEGEDVNPRRVMQELSVVEPSQNFARDAKGQLLQSEAPTIAELCESKRGKERITYSPLTPDDGKRDVLFDRLWSLWGGGAYEDRARRRFNKTLDGGVEPDAILEAAERRRKRLDQSGFQDDSRLYLWLRRGDWQREPSVSQLVFVEYGSEAGRAWERHWLKTRRVRPSWQCMPGQGFRRGRYFPSEFPPDGTT